MGLDIYIFVVVAILIGCMAGWLLCTAIEFGEQIFFIMLIGLSIMSVTYLVLLGQAMHLF